MTEMSQVFFSKWSLFAVALMTISLSGCGGPPPKPMGTFSGTLKSSGEPCGDCRISLFNTTTLASKGGRVDENGEFEFKELPFGEYEIYIYQKPTNAVKEVIDERIPDKYKTKETSGLKASITSAEPVTLDIDMK